jgi:hypothetical protein
MRPDSSPRWKAAMAAMQAVAIVCGIAGGTWIFDRLTG